MLEKLLQWDRETFVYLNNLGIDELDGFWSVATEITTWTPLFLFFFILLLYRQRRLHGLFKVLTLVLLLFFVLSLTNITKEWVMRLRPNNDQEVNGLIRILKHPVDYSFFSGHAASSFSMTVLMYLFLGSKWRWVVLFFVWPIVFSMSRIFVGVHFPIDIIVGALVGSLCALLFHKLYLKLIPLYSRSVHPE